MMFIVVAYDIPDDKRRTRLHKKLKNFGTPVQFSVFECLLTEKEFQRMQAVVKHVIKREEDLVRYYQLCDTCRTKIMIPAQGVVTQDIRTIVV